MEWEREKELFLDLLEKVKEKYQLEKKGYELLEKKKSNVYVGVVESETPASFLLKFGGGISDGYGNSPNVIVVETTTAQGLELKDTPSECLGREMYGKLYRKNIKIRKRRC